MGDQRRMMKAMGDFIKVLKERITATVFWMPICVREGLRKVEETQTRKLATKLYELIVDEYTKAPGMKSAPMAEADRQLIQPKFDSYRKIQFVGSSKSNKKL